MRKKSIDNAWRQDKNLRNYSSACKISFRKFIGLYLLTNLLHSDWKKENHENNAVRSKTAIFHKTFYTFTINGPLQQQHNSIKCKSFALFVENNE